ncbi:MAG: argininosuccinate lyase [Planctomycetes bacterium]|nr:argininosuccinate lyase [Planctomycetota bacterium]
MTKLWGGRFEGGTDPRFEAFNRSLPFDRRLVVEDVVGSAAWARALQKVGVLTVTEAMSLIAALAEIEVEVVRDPSLAAQSDAEDVHAFVESRLKSKVGDLARKLHTGRSRNDQVATDLRLWMKRAAAEIDAGLIEACGALVALAEPNAAMPMPGYTHLQRAQAVTVGHTLLAYVEMLARDRTRLADCVARFDACPLGSGALAGTAYAIDREALARDLGFARATRNSLDAVSDRDHVSELMFTCAVIGVHLSRLAEDWIFFATTEAGFLELSDAVATGSSLMPQKKNPDSLELLRGKAGRSIGRLTGFLATQKSLPLAYDKDLQEDKEALFDAVDTARDSLAVAAIVVKNARFRADRCRSEASKGYLNATDLADLLVEHGVSFRDAHEKAGIAVRTAIEHGIELEQLSDADRARLLPELARVSRADFAAALSVEASLARRSALGGTSPVRVAEEVEAWKKKISTWNNRS